MDTQQPSPQGSQQQQKNPVFQARPGWGQAFRKHLKTRVVPIIGIAVVVILVFTLSDRTPKPGAVASPTPSFPSGPPFSPEGGMVQYSAQKGDSVTRLARRALRDYRAVNPTVLLSPEQKIYVEDYLKDIAGSRIIRVDEVIAFNPADIIAGIEKAKGLTPGQINNLAKYVALVPELKEEDQ